MSIEGEASGHATSNDLECFLREVGPMLTRGARVLCDSTAEAEDLVQETMVRIIRHWRRVRASDNPSGYARRMLSNEHIRQSRKNRPIRPPNVPEAINLATNLEDEQVVRELLTSLPPKQRIAVVLRYLFEVDYEEIALTLKCKPATARSHVKRGLDALKVQHERTQDEEIRYEELY